MRFEDRVKSARLVRSDFGWHIIKLEATRGGEVRPFESVRAEIEDNQRIATGSAALPGTCRGFQHHGFRAAGFAGTCGQETGLEHCSVPPCSDKPAAGADLGPLASPKLLDAVFGPETLRNKRNTDAVETAANQMVRGTCAAAPAGRGCPVLADVKEAQVRQQLLDGNTRRRSGCKKAGRTNAWPRALPAGTTAWPSSSGCRALKSKACPSEVLELRAARRRPTSCHRAGGRGARRGNGYWRGEAGAGGRTRHARISVPAEAAARQVAQAWAKRRSACLH